MASSSSARRSSTTSEPGEELINEPFARLIEEKQLVSQSYDGFWMSMDTFKDKKLLDDLYTDGRAPWEVWKAVPPSFAI